MMPAVTLFLNVFIINLKECLIKKYLIIREQHEPNHYHSGDRCRWF
jgi:hypothetical protein